MAVADVMFWTDKSIIPHRYTFGSALFVGWVSGGLLLVGGIVMCIACKGMVPEETR